MKDPLFELLQPKRNTAVVDIGANPIDGVPPYKPMLNKGICNVIGFDPQESAINMLKQKNSPYETYLPYAIGDGSVQTLYKCHASGMTSTLKPDTKHLSLFPLFEKFGEVLETQQIETRMLDDVDEIENLDFLKIDIQGAELSVFRSGQKKLSKAVAIQTEVSFLPLYEEQPTMGTLDMELRSQGFIPHAMQKLKRWIISPMLVKNNPRKPLNQLLEADLVYVRDFSNPEELSDEQLKHLSLIAHHCYNSFDLTLFCIIELDKRECLTSDIRNTYLEMLGTKL